MSYNELLKEFECKMNVTDYIQAQVHHGESGGIEYVKNLIDCNDEIAIKILDEYGRFNQLSQEEIRRVNSQPVNKNVPRCPICQSTNLSKITNTSKAVKIAMFGVFGMGDNGKEWKCNNCGSRF